MNRSGKYDWDIVNPVGGGFTESKESMLTSGVGGIPYETDGDARRLA